MEDMDMDDYFSSRDKRSIPESTTPQHYVNNDLKNLNETLQNISNLLKTNNKVLTDLSNQTKNSVYDTSNKIIWYDVASSVATSTLTDPGDATSASYTSLNIYNELRKNSPKISIFNDGPGTLYTIVSHNINQYSSEFPIYEGEAKAYADVREIKFRAPVAGCKYRVTEYDLWKQKNVDFRAGRGYVRTQTIAVAGATPALAYVVADTHNFNGTLTRNASTGYIKNTNALTDLWVWFSQDGTEYGQSGAGIAVEYTTVDPNGAINIDYMDVHSVKLGSSGLITYQIVTA